MGNRKQQVLIRKGVAGLGADWLVFHLACMPLVFWMKHHRAREKLDTSNAILMFLLLQILPHDCYWQQHRSFFIHRGLTFKDIAKMEKTRWCFKTLKILEFFRDNWSLAKLTNILEWIWFSSIISVVKGNLIQSSFSLCVPHCKGEWSVKKNVPCVKWSLPRLTGKAEYSYKSPEHRLWHLDIDSIRFWLLIQVQ